MSGGAVAGRTNLDAKSWRMRRVDMHGERSSLLHER
jgi:hypothetical protein